MPSIRPHDRVYDLVIFGATGYTGKLTAEYVATHLPTDLKWALAGRTESKLRAVADDCRRMNPNRIQPEIEIASLNDEDLAALAKKTRAMVTSVGPYSLYGEFAFKACAEAGTHYVDVTGEAVWVHNMIKKYEATAKKSGAIMFPQSGIESLPADVCTWALTNAIRKELGVHTKDATVSLHKISSTPSGGTMATALTLFDVFSVNEVRDASGPYAQSPIPHKEPARRQDTLLQRLFGVRTIPSLGLVTTSALGGTDVAVVERTWGLLSETPSRKDQFYGPNFTWAEYFKARNWLHGVFVHIMLLLGSMVLAFAPPIRTLMKKRVYQPGEGLSRDDTQKEEIEFRAIATPDSEEFAGKQAYCRAWHHGGMYWLTALFMTEVATTLLEDDVELEGGIYTPACLGQGLIDRIDKRGFKVEVQIRDA